MEELRGERAPRDADDFAAIRARMEELRRERAQMSAARDAKPLCPQPYGRQRRGVGSRFLRFLAQIGHDILGQARAVAGLGREEFAGRDGALVLFNLSDRQLAGL